MNNLRNFVRAIQERRLVKSIWRLLREPGTFSHFLFVSLPRYIRNKLSYRNTVRLAEIRSPKDLGNQQYVASDEDLSRLCRSYSQMIQETPKNAESPYFVGGLWEEWKTHHQTQLVRALLAKDFSTLRGLFSNLGVEEASRGISLSGDFARGIYARTLQANRINSLLSTYRAIYPNGQIKLYPKNWGAFPGPLVKNENGSSGVMIPSGPRLSHNAQTLNSLSLAARALTARGRKDGGGDILEIGGGFGGVAYHLYNETDFRGTYTNIDIPEVLIISAAFLFSEFKSENIFLYGDSADRKESPIHLVPHYTMATVPRNTSAVIFNSHSLTEMNFSTIEEYLRQIERISPVFFLHQNHEYGSEYLVAGRPKHHAVIGEGSLRFRDGVFERISRTPEVLTNDGEDFGKLDYWENLYINLSPNPLS